MTTIFSTLLTLLVSATLRLEIKEDKKAKYLANTALFLSVVVLALKIIE